MIAKRRILSYNHPRPRQTLATQAQVDSFEAFLAWRRLLSSEILNSPTWVGVLHGMAVKSAEREERAAQHASLVKWQAWIHDGQADGLRRQHRFSRTPDGWIPTAKATGLWEGIDQSDEIEGLDGLSREELNTIKFEHAEKGVPADSQQQVDEQAERWHVEWGKDVVQDPIHWPKDLGNDLEQLLVEELLDAAQTFPNETGLGWDRIHPKAILRMSKAGK